MHRLFQVIPSYSKFYSKLIQVYSKMSSRITRSKTAIKTPPPAVCDIMDRIDSLTGKYYENINKEFAVVDKYYKGDGDKIASFFIEDWEFDLTDFKHRYLLRKIFEHEAIGLKHNLVTEFLDKITDSSLLSQMGVTRFTRDNKVFYRIRVGISSEY